MSEEEVPLMRGGDGVKMDFDGRSISFSSDEPNFFIARITESGGCSDPPKYIYAWEEMTPAGDGITYQVKPNGRTGTLTERPAFELNNSSVSVGKIVFMRERSYATGAFTCPEYTGTNLNTPVYDFVYGGAGGPELCPRVSNVTCTAGFMVVSYQLQCETVTEPIGSPPAGGPVGTIAMWSVATIPDGWLECNGQEFSAVTYPELFVALGGNTWNVPDLRDKFVRGHGATGKGNLRDTKPYKTGAPINPFVAGAAGSHSHTNAPGSPIMVSSGTGGTTLTGYTNSGTTSTAQNHTHTITGGDSETVPEHIILKYIIKART